MRLALRLIFPLRSIALVLAVSSFVGASPAQSGTQPASVWIDAVRTLAGRIASFTPPSDALHLDFKNLSSVDAAEAAAVSRELAAELTRRGFHLSTDAGAAAQAELTLSESADGYLLVARVHRGEGGEGDHQVADEVAIAVGPPRAGGVPGPGGDSLTLARKTVWEQRQPILDFAILPADASGGTPLLLILQPESLALYAKPNVQWVTGDSAPLRHASPWPRDLRGWIDLNNRKIELPGLECTGDLEKPAAMQCVPANANGKFPRELKQLPLAVPAANGNESDDALLLDLNCSNGRVALATGSGDWTEPDSIQAFELRDEALVPSGDPLPFSGPILALWPSGDLKSARVVERNLRTGMYEASIISVTCGN